MTYVRCTKVMAVHILQLLTPLLSDFQALAETTESDVFGFQNFDTTYMKLLDKLPV